MTARQDSRVPAPLHFLSAESERLDRRMEEEFGPDWRQKSEERLKAIMSCRFTQT